ncbi:MAG: hypothetical protein J6S40_02255 [Thermoguttaceae bacterium]|nr:hypothetical protein [Thermoguttaceae bacterium]
MSWQGIEGHDRVAEMFSRAFSRGRLEGSFLFTGPEGIGKRTFAFQLAKTVLCLSPDGFVPCGTCESCRLFDMKYRPVKEEVVRDEKPLPAKSRRAAPPSLEPDEPDDPLAFDIPNHPDFYYVSKPADRAQIPIDLLAGPKENRGRSGLCYNIFRTPYLGSRKVAVIDDADFLNEEGANSLLKTLEEPPRGAVIILIGTSAAKQLPTIRSRCQSVRFLPLSLLDLSTVLVNRGIAADFDEAKRLARFADGSCKNALEFNDASLETFRPVLYKQLAQPEIDALAFSKRVIEFVEEKKKDKEKARESELKRRRLALVLARAARFYRDLTRLLSGETSLLAGNIESGAELRLAAKNRPDPDRAIRNAERTVGALEQIDRMGNLPYIIEAWLSDL